MIRLRRLTIRGFGGLALPEVPFDFADDRITLLLGPNEAGKTTLAEALYAALYGMEHRRSTKNTPLPLEERWLPRGDGDAPFGVRLLVEDDGRLLLADWNFAERTLHVTDERTGKDVTDAFHVGRNKYDLGEQLTGLSDEEFRKVCYVAQGELGAAEELGGIAGLVQRYAATSPGTGRTSSEAIRAIENTLARYPASTQGKGRLQIDNELERLDVRLQEIEREMDELHRRRAEAAEAEETYERLCAKEREIESRIETLQAARSAAERQELRERVARAQAVRKELDALTEERDALAHLDDFPADDTERVTRLDTEIAGLVERSEAIQQTLDGKHASVLDSRQREAAEFGALAEINDGQVRAIEALAVRAADNAGRLRRVDHEREIEHRRLVAENAAPAELQALRKELGSFSDEALEEAASYNAKRAELQSRLAGLQNEFAQTGQELASLKRRTARRRAIGTALTAAGLLVAAAGVVLPRLVALPHGLTGVAIALGALLFVGGLALRLALGGAPAELPNLEQAQRDKDQERADLQRDIRRLREAMERRAAACGARSPEQLAEKALRLLELQRRTATFRELDRRFKDLEATQADILRDARQTSERFGYPLDHGDISASLQAFAERARKARAAAQALQTAQRQRQELLGDLDAIKADLSTRVEQLRDILRRAGIEEQNRRDAVGRFADGVKRHARYRRLVDELLPRLAERMPAAETLAEWNARIALLKEQAASADADGASASELSDRIDAARRELDATEDGRQDVGMRIHTLLAEHRARLPALTEERDALQAQRHKVIRHRDALHLALEELRAVATEIHREWAEELNRRANAWLAAFSPSLSRLRFDDSLNFTARQSERGMTFEPGASGPALSAGQRDQLYLAVRLGIADFLGSRENPLPLILDDPFVNFDDERYAAAMRFLAERALPGHQIILLTCHRRRVEWLRDTGPDWFAAHVAERDIPADA